jgi:hypothetical protein
MKRFVILKGREIARPVAVSSGLKVLTKNLPFQPETGCCQLILPVAGRSPKQLPSIVQPS